MTDIRPSGPYRNHQVSDAILRAAQQVLAEAGAAGFTIEAVARSAGAGKPTIYRWWPSRADLLVDVYDLEKTALVTPIETDDPLGDLVTYTATLWQFWRDHPAGRAFRILIAEAQTDPRAMTALRDRFLPTRLATVTAMMGRICGANDALLDMRVQLWLGFAWQALLTDRIAADMAGIRDAMRLITA